MEKLSFRKIVSLTSLTSFLFLLITGIVLYIVPHGRVANWADWRLWGLSKGQWTELHINLALLFLIASAFHIYYNWNPIVAYLKNRAKQVVVFNRNFSIAFVVTLLFLVGTGFGIPPLKTVIDISEGIKDSSEEKYGSPPYGHAERSSLKLFTKRMGLDLKESLRILKEEGVKFSDENETLAEISRKNGTSPQQVYMTIKDAKKAGTKMASSAGSQGSSAGTAPTGLGRKTFAQLAEENGIDIESGLTKLKQKNIQAEPDMKVKKVADQAGMSPLDLYEIMK